MSALAGPHVKSVFCLTYAGISWRRAFHRTHPCTLACPWSGSSSIDSGEPTTPAAVKPRERSTSSKRDLSSRVTAFASGASGAASRTAWMRTAHERADSMARAPASSPSSRHASTIVRWAEVVRWASRRACPPYVHRVADTVGPIAAHRAACAAGMPRAVRCSRALLPGRIVVGVGVALMRIPRLDRARRSKAQPCTPRKDCAGSLQSGLPPRRRRPS